MWIPLDTGSIALVGQFTLCDPLTTARTNISYSCTCTPTTGSYCHVMICFFKPVASFFLPPTYIPHFPQRTLVPFMYPCSPLYPCKLEPVIRSVLSDSSRDRQPARLCLYYYQPITRRDIPSRDWRQSCPTRAPLPARARSNDHNLQGPQTTYERHIDTCV